VIGDLTPFHFFTTETLFSCFEFIDPGILKKQLQKEDIRTIIFGCYKNSIRVIIVYHNNNTIGLETLLVIRIDKITTEE
jgi:hypothetical protein